MLINAMIITMTSNPAALTAAAVSSPEMAEATVRPARTRVITSMRTAARGVFNEDIIPLIIYSPPNYQH